MSVADKLLQVNQVKQAIKTAIETKGVDLTGVAFTDYADKILDISGGGGVVDEYFYYSKAYYTITNNATLFANAWQDMEDSETVLFDIPLMFNQEMDGLDVYVGTDGQLQALYNACANETIPPPIDSNTRDVYYVNNVATYYMGDISGDVGFPVPAYSFGDFFAFNDNTSFLIADLTPLSMGIGLALLKLVNVSIPNNNIVIQQGVEFENENQSGIIIPNSVTTIGDYAFQNWWSNNQPLVIPDSVTSIGNYAFYFWESNNQPLVIPDSVTSIKNNAFESWVSNNHPLVIPDSVTSIGSYTFFGWGSNTHPLVIPDGVTSIGNGAFSGWGSNNQPLVIPDSVTSIGESAFAYWYSNTHPLVIPDSITSIGNNAFYGWSSVPYIEIQATTPPTLADTYAFGGQGNAPIYVPDESVDDYKEATNWVSLASRIFSINDK